ncbi:MAG: hypothetical protein J0H49_22010 [Acidobacteria bacterium]|nr:hypothetical protein [Acidobacteriota bacterium]
MPLFARVVGQKFDKQMRKRAAVGRSGRQDEIVGFPGRWWSHEKTRLISHCRTIQEDSLTARSPCKEGGEHRTIHGYLVANSLA